MRRFANSDGTTPPPSVLRSAGKPGRFSAVFVRAGSKTQGFVEKYSILRLRSQVTSYVNPLRQVCLDPLPGQVSGATIALVRTASHPLTAFVVVVRAFHPEPANPDDL